MTYTGPTSGRITVGGGKATVRESWTEEQDPRLTQDEQAATEWFRRLPPNEQLRTVRVLKWNADVYKSQFDEAQEVLREQRTEIDRLRNQLARHAPDGYMLPGPAADLIGHAERNGWQTDRVWTEYEDGRVTVDVGVTSAGRVYKLCWSCDPGGAGRMVRSGLARAPGRDWHDAPSLKKIRWDIAAHPAD